MNCLSAFRKPQPLTIVNAQAYGSLQCAVFRSRNHSDLFYAETKLPLTDHQHSNPWAWDKPPRKYDQSLLYPRFKASKMTLAPTNQETSYVKELHLLKLGLRLFEKPWSCDVTLREIEMCELLLKHSHPKVCQYRGVVVEGGRVKGLVFERYDMNLRQALERGHHVNVKKCISHVKRALRRFHSLGLVHGDVKAENVFVNVAMQQYCLGDFDAVHREGGTLC